MDVLLDALNPHHTDKFNVMQVYRKLIKDYGSEDNVRALSQDEVLQQFGYAHRNKLAVLAIIGAQTTLLRKYTEHFDEFTRRSKLSSKTTRTTFKSIYWPLFLKLSNMESVPTDEEQEIFQDFLGKISVTAGRVLSVLTVLSIRQAHPDYVIAANKRFCILDVEELWSTMICMCQARNQGRHKQYIEPFTGHMLSRTSIRAFVATIQHQTKDTDVLQCSSTLPVDTAKVLIEDKAELVGYRMLVLQCTGFKHMDKLLEFKTQFDTRITEYHELFAEVTAVSKFCPVKFVKLEELLGVRIASMACIDPEDLVQRLLNSPHPRFNYKIISYIFETDTDALQYFAQNLPYEFTHINKRERDLVNSTPWMKKILTDIFETYKQRLQQSSAYPETQLKKVEEGLFHFLDFLQMYVMVTFEPVASDAIRWFFSACDDVCKVTDALIAYGENLGVNNDFVKSRHEQHHAIRRVGAMLSFFKHDVVTHLPCGPEMMDIQLSEILMNIENRRQPADERNRREFTDEEVNAMLTSVQKFPVRNLMLILLREVGLRIGCIRHMKYYDLVEEKTHAPKHKCTVLEKMRLKRIFLTSARVKAAVQLYIDQLPSHVAYQNIFIFNEHQLYEPVAASSISYVLKHIAKIAGVTGIDVHVHAFRHTLVGKLFEYGNSAELVSKFMGHSTSSTTIKHYFVKTVQQLNDSINNPFIQNNQQEEDEEEKINDITINSLEVIHQYNNILAEYMEKNPLAGQVFTTVMDHVPNLQSILADIASLIDDKEEDVTESEEVESDVDV
jgi:integrase